VRFSEVGKSAVMVVSLTIVSAALIAYGSTYLDRAAAVAACSCLVACLAAFVLWYRPNASLGKVRGVSSPNAPRKEQPLIPLTILFILMLSGPPMFRGRDPLASVRGEIDTVVLIQMTVWVLAGLWTLRQLFLRRLGSRPLLPSHFPLRLGLLLMLLLAASTLVSPGPALTAFKVYQMLVMLLFPSMLVEEYGVRACLRLLLVGYAVLSLAIVVSIFVAPGLVIAGEAARVRGDALVDTGSISVFTLIMLFTSAVELSTIPYLVLAGIDLVLLAVSRTRTAYVAFFAFLMLAILVRPAISRLRWVLGATLAAIAAIAMTGLGPATAWLVREPESISTLSDRVGLWSYLLDVLLKKSPWIGLGYYSASRVYGLEYNSNLGTAHSGWIEILVGGGFLSLAVFVLLMGAIIACAVRLLPRIKTDRFSFASCALLVAVLAFSSMGWGEFDFGPVALTFWCLVAILPSLASDSGRDFFARFAELPPSREQRPTERGGL